MNNTENLEQKLRSMYVSWRHVLFIRGIAQSFGCLLACIIGGCLLDMFCNLSFALRLMLMLAIYIAVCAFTWFAWLKDYLEPFSLPRMAWLIERAFPRLNEKLISSVELAHGTNENVSMQLIGKLLEDVNIDLDKIKPANVFPLKLSYFKLPAIFAILFILAIFIPQLNFPLLLNRVMLPSTADASMGPFSILVMSPHDETCNEGDTIIFKARATKDDLATADLIIEGKKTSRFLMDYNKEEKVFEYKYSCGRDDFRYWVTAEDCKSVTFTVKVNKRPSIDKFNISYQFPPYTRLELLKVESTTGDIKALINTKVNIDVETPTKIKSAKIMMDKEEIKGTVGPDGKHVLFDLAVADSRDYSIELTDVKGLTNQRKFKYRITALEDKSPVVKLIEPENDLSVYAEDEISLKWESADDFGVRKQQLVIVPNGDIGQKKVFELKPDAKAEKIKLADLNIKYGGDADVFIRAEDDAGHFGNSQPCTLHIGGLRFKDSQQFVAELETIQQSLKSVKNRLSIYNELFFRFDSVASRDQDETAHQQRLLEQQIDQIQANLSTAQEASEKLKDLGFFRKSSFYTELVRRYILQEKLYQATRLGNQQELNSATEKIEEMITLNRKMVRLLKEKAYQNIANFKTPEMLLGLQKASLPKRLQLRQQTFEMAAGMDFKLFDRIKTNSKQEQSGLYRYLYLLDKGQFNNYVNPGAFPQEAEVDYTINFPDVKVLTNAESFAITWYGELHIETPGLYLFKVTSSDGTRLYVNNQLVVELDGIHKAKTKNGNINLLKGIYPIGITYFNQKQPGTIMVYMQPPDGEMAPLGPPNLFCSGFLSVNRLITLLSVKAKETVNDYAELDKTAAEIMKRLISEQKQLEQLATKLAAHNRPEDWKSLEKLAEEVRKTAEQEQDKQQKVDRKLVADAIKKAAEDKNTDNLHELAENLTQLNKQAELRDLEKSIDKLKDKFADKIDQLEKAAAKNSDKDSVKDRVDELAKDIEQTAAEIEAVNKLNNQQLDVTGKVENLKNDLKNIENKVNQNQLAQVKPEADKLQQNMANPEKSIENEIAANKENTEKARDKIRQLAESKADKLKDMQQEAADLAKKTGKEQENADKKEALGEKLANLANDLRDEAANEIEKDQADVDSAKEKVAIAAMLDKINDQMNPDENSKDSPAKLQDSLNQMKKAAELLDKHEKMDNSRMAEEQARKEHDNILDTAKKADQELQKILDEIDRSSALKQAENNIRKLADQSQQLENKANQQQAGELSGKTDREKQNLEDLGKNSPPTAPKEQQWQEGDIAANLEKQPDSNQVARAIDEMRKNLAQAEAHKQNENAMDKDLMKHDAAFQKIADNIDPKKLNENEKKRLDDIKKAFPENALGTKKALAEEMARTLQKKDREAENNLKKLADQIGKDFPKEGQRNQQANMAKAYDQNMKNQAEQLKQALREQDPSEKQVNEKLLEDLKRHAVAQDYQAVKDNLDALEKNLRQEIPEVKPQEVQEEIDNKRADYLNALNDAIRKSNEKEQKDKLDQAKKAALAGNLKEAENLTREAIKNKQDDIKLAKDLEKADDFRKQNVDKVREALNDLQQNKLAEAAAKLNDTPQATKEKKQLQEAASKVNEGIKDALAKAWQDPQKANQNLENAARNALQNQLENAAAQAKQAGKEGQEAMEKFSDAVTAKKTAEKSLNDLMKNAAEKNQDAAKVMAELPETRKNAENQLAQLQQQQQNDKSPELAQKIAAMDAKKNNLKIAEDLLKAQRLNEAAEHAKRATQGAFEADKALDALGEAIKEQQQLAQMKKDQPPLLPPGSLAEPVKELQNAEASLNKGQVKNDATQSLQKAADKLGQMAQNAMNQAQQQLAQQNNNAMPSNSESKGNNERQGDGVQLADGALENTKQDWAGTDATLTGENEKGQKTSYSSYYRKANKEYLNKISKESKNWE